MGNQLDSILKRQLIVAPETINSDFISSIVDLDNREGEFSISIRYDNGVGLNMTTSIELSNTPLDGNSWVLLADSDLIQNDASGNIVYDLGGTGLSYLRVKIVVASGSCDLQSMLYVAKKRH
jgi:hypothetical protein